MRLTERADITTYEFENVPDESIGFLSGLVPVHPNAIVLAVARDRLREKALFGELEIPIPGFAAVDSQADLERAADFDAAWARLGVARAILERFIFAFHAARGPST